MTRVIVAAALACPLMWAATTDALEVVAELGDRAAVRRVFVDARGESRVGAWWWNADVQAWSPAPDASWHGPVTEGDARWRWTDVAAIRHVEISGRGRWAMVLDRGAATAQEALPVGVGGAKLVALCSLTGGVVDVWWFDAGHEQVAGSRLTDFVIDAGGTTAVIHDTGTRSVLVVDLVGRRAHRALRGRVPAEAQLTLDETYGWLTWRSVGQAVGWRVPWEELRDARFDATALAHLVEPASVDGGWVPRPTKVSTADLPLRVALSEGAGSLGVQLARPWAKAGLWRGVGMSEAHVVLQREAARGATEAARERVLAQEP